MPAVPDLGLTEKYRTIVVIAIALVGAFLGWLVIFFGYLSDAAFTWTDAHKEFTRESRFLVWLFLELVQTGAWPLLILLALARIREISAYFRGNYGEIVLSSLVFFAAALAIAAGGVFGPDLPGWLPGYEAKLMLLSAAAIAVGLVAAIGIWKAQGALRQLLAEIEAGQAAKAQVDHMLHLKDALTLFLGTLGVLLSLAIFAAGAERKAIEAYGKRGDPSFQIDSAFPTDYLVLYGLLMSLLIGLAYAPAHITFLAAGRRLRDALVPMLEPTDANWQNRFGERRDFEDLIELRATTGSNLKAGILALSPLLASLTGLIGS